VITFSIVTPAWNSERFITETIESVISQKGDFAIEYIIVDNASSDSTLEIANRYKTLIECRHYPVHCNKVSLQIISEEDEGMYDALNKGFRNATGNIYAWINSDDLYLPGAFSVVAKTFRKYPQVLWLKGITSYINDSSTVFKTGKYNLYDSDWIKKGVYGRDLYFIQQDSVFFRSSLWAISGNFNPGLKLAGDYALWISFAEKTLLNSLKAYVSCFRHSDKQLSKNVDGYTHEMIQIAPQKDIVCKMVSAYFRLATYIPVIIRPCIFRLLFGNRRYHIVTLDGNQEPNLRSCSFYQALGLR